MKGAKYVEGDFSDDWIHWVNTNLLRGVDAGVIVDILTKKGFHPVKNTRLMHRLLCWNSLDIYLHKLSDVFDSNSTKVNSTGSVTSAQVRHAVSGIKVDARFMRWVTEIVRKGVDGELVVELLLERDVDLAKEQYLFAQKIQRNELSSLMEKDVQRAEILDFWKACKYGYYDEVQLFCRCNAPFNEEKLDVHSSQRSTPLMLAAMNGHSNVVKLLASCGTNINAIDRMGRSAIHYAAKNGHTDTCAQLIRKGAMRFAGDFHGNTPLHLAAMYNHPRTVHFLAGKGQEVVRLITSDKVRARKNSTFDEIVEEVFVKLPLSKLSQAATIR